MKIYRRSEPNNNLGGSVTIDIVIEQILRNLLEIAILRILQEEALHGYAIVQKLKLLLNRDFTPNVVYPILYKLENNKLIKSQVVQRGKRQIIRVYSITERGREIFQRVSEIAKRVI